MNNNQGASVNFRVGGKEVEAYMEKMREKAKAMANETIQNAKMQTDSSKEQINLIKEQIRLLERKNSMERQASLLNYTQVRDSSIAARTQKAHQYIDKEFDFMPSSEREELKRDASRNIERAEREKYDEQIRVMREQFRENQLQTTLMRQEIDAIKTSGNKLDNTIQNSNDNLFSEIADNADRERVEAVEKQNREKIEGNRGKGRGFLQDIVNYSFIDDAIKGSKGIVTSNNGFEAARGMGDVLSSSLGMTGAAAGTALSGGNPLVGAIVGKLVSGITDAVSDVVMKTAEQRERVYGQMGRVRSLTGNWQSMEDNSQSGFDYGQVAEAQLQVAAGYGSSRNLGRRTTDYLNIQKGIGVDAGTLGTIMELQRGRSDADIAKVINGVLATSKVVNQTDRSFLPMYLSNTLSLQRELLSKSDDVSSRTASTIIETFNDIGGQFGAKDFRSAQNINAVQSGLSNPQGDNLKALSFMALQQANPGKGIFDLLEMQQKGLDTPGYLKNMMDLVNKIGGSDQFKMMNLSQLFPGLSLSAVRDLYSGYKNGDLDLSKISYDSFNLNEEGQKRVSKTLQWEGYESTSDLDRMNARQSNAVVEGMKESMKESVNQFAQAIVKAFQGVQLNIITSPDGQPKKIIPNIVHSGQ